MVLVGYLHMILFAKLNHHQLALVGFIVQIRWCFESTQTSGENLKKIWGPWWQILVSIGLNDPFIIIHYLISSKRSLIFSYNFDMWKPCVITTVQFHSAKPELRFCGGTNPAYGLLEIRDGEDLWQWSRLEISYHHYHHHHHHIFWILQPVDFEWLQLDSNPQLLSL